MDDLQRFVVLTSGRPAWVLPLSALDLDFANNRYFGGTPSNSLSLTRASSATDLRPTSASGAAYSTYGSGVLRINSSGLLIEEARTNLLLNSTAPVTQTTASLGTGSYTLWVNGAGSAIASAGTATITGEAAATNGSPDTFSVTGAGTVTITVTGALNAFQLELGTFGTSLIITAGSTAQRAADVISLTGQAATKALAAKAAFFQTTGLPDGSVTGGNFSRWLTFSGDGSAFIGRGSNNTQVFFTDGTNTATATVGSGSTQTTLKIATAWGSPTFSILANGGSKATSANAFTPGAGTFYLGNQSAGIRALNGYMQRFALSLTKGAFDARTA